MRLKSQEFKGIVFRIHAPDKEALDTSASREYGGRWNRPEKYGVLYTSLTLETAEAEYKTQLQKRGLAADDLFDRSISTIEVRLQRVLDFSDPDRQKEFRISESELESDDDISRKKMLDLADEARAHGYEAIISPSARLRKGKNLNVFMDLLRDKSFIKRIKTERPSGK